MNTSSRISAFLAYLLLIIGWLYIFLFRRNDKLALYHTKQSIMLVMVAIGAPVSWAVLSWLIALIPLVGPPIATALFALVIASYALLLVNWVVGMVYALQSKLRPLPVVGKWAERLFGA